MTGKLPRMAREKKAKAERIWNFVCALTVDGYDECRAVFSCTMAKALAMFRADTKLPNISRMVLYREGKAICRYNRANRPCAGQTTMT